MLEMYSLELLANCVFPIWTALYQEVPEFYFTCEHYSLMITENSIFAKLFYQCKDDIPKFSTDGGIFYSFQA